MQVTEPEDAQGPAVLVRATIALAVRGAPDLMGRLVAHTRATLRDLETRAYDERERNRLTASRRQLNQCEADLLARFTDELKAAFDRTAARDQVAIGEVGDPHFDQIGGMNAAQVQERVENARVRHAVQIAAGHALMELNGLMCRLLGLEQAQLERNPLRPAVYVDAVATALGQLPVPAAVRQGWLSLMSGALGQELDIYYRQLCEDLRMQGVGAIQAVNPESAAAIPSASEGSTLTLERLRVLLGRTSARRALVESELYHAASEPAPLEAGDTVADAGPSAFQATVPAAFEAAREMRQLDRMAQRLDGRQAALGPEKDHPVRGQLRAQAHGLDQTLALEVVALMVDNIRHDPRLLAPVRDLVAQLEPALLQLALVDPQFFSHKEHPARKLLHEITHRSIAFESPESRGFSGFIDPLHEAVAPLAQSAIAGAEPFDDVLARLMGIWDAPRAGEQRKIALAVHALRQAEQRAALAATMVREVLQRPDAVLVPSVVLDFLCGPWAQVVAHARMTDRTGADDPGHYGGLIDTLLWSAQPALAGQDLPALRQRMPELRQRLQQGLASIDFPPAQARDFFEQLEQLHRQAQDGGAVADAQGESQGQGAPAPASVARWNDTDDGTWLAPQEARDSGFIDMPGESAHAHEAGAAMGGALVAGVWVALMVEGSWTRTRLAWSSANGSLLLFADALGFVQSMSRRSCEQLFANGHLRIISSDPVEDALDAVARTALRNSVDVKI